MGAQIIKKTESSISINIEIPLDKSMLASEESILRSLNEAGALATGELLGRFDTDGSPIIMGEVKYFSKYRGPKPYQTPYGEIEVERHVYQTSKGGRSFCPLEKDARIIGTSTPRFAKIVSHKYAYGGAPEVVKDLSENHGRKIVRSFVKGISDLVGTVALAKEESWDYSLPECDVPIHSISIGLDGTYVRMTEGDFHEAMVGSISLYDKEGNRQDSIYIGASPEYGKGRFLERMRREIERVKGVYQNASYIGLADGARSNWDFLNKHTEHQLIDFYHASEYLHKAATSTYTKKSEHQEKWGWLDDNHHNLKHKQGAAARILNDMTTWQDKKMSEDNRKQLESSITYFTNNKSRMRYSYFVDRNLPIGSGVTESACKMIVKQRLCNSGMMWKNEGIDIVMSLRCLTYSGNKWQQFWNKIDQYGFSLAA